MKAKVKSIIAMTMFSAACALVAQENMPPRGGFGGPGGMGGPGGPGGMGHRPPPPPIIVALDVNHDGTIDADEISNSVAVLKSLDRNGDGKLTPDELRPPRPEVRDQDGPGPEGPLPQD